MLLVYKTIQLFLIRNPRSVLSAVMVPDHDLNYRAVRGEGVDHHLVIK